MIVTRDSGKVDNVEHESKEENVTNIAAKSQETEIEMPAGVPAESTATLASTDAADNCEDLDIME